MSVDNWMIAMMRGMGQRGLSVLLALPLCATIACAADPVDEPSESDQLTHCVAEIGGGSSCYATFTEAIAAATGGRITDADADSTAAFADGTLTDRINAIWDERTAKPGTNVDPPVPGNGGNVVIGIVYHDQGFRGKDWVFIASQGCINQGPNDPFDWAVQNLNAGPYTNSQMNDNISSARAFAGCFMNLYVDWKLNAENPTAGFVSILTGDVGDFMNDKTSSIAWRTPSNAGPRPPL